MRACADLQDIAKAAKSDPKVLEAYGQFLAKDDKGNFSKDKDEVVVGQRLNAYVEAKKICSACAHIVECGQWAIRNEKHGFWGGYSPEERKQIRGKLNIILTEDMTFALQE